MKYTDHFSTRDTNLTTTQARAIPGREAEMTKNSDGAMVFQADKWTRLHRFLILGSEGGSYYASAGKLTRDNAKNVVACIKEDGIRVVNTLTAISQEGRAPKNDPALFVLAMCTSPDLADGATRKAAFAVLPKVARIGTHLFQFVDFAEKFRGWGRAMKNGVGGWYQNMDPNRLAYQMIKYQQRGGWSHRDLLRLAKPVPEKNSTHNLLYHYATKGDIPGDASPVPSILVGHEAIKHASSPEKAAEYVKAYNLPRESVPTEFLKEKVVWEALLEKMPMMALIRNLRNLSKCGLLVPMSSAVPQVVAKLTDTEALRKARIHPLSVMNALMVYKVGSDERGNNWNVVGPVRDALEDSFYASFKNVEPTGKRFHLALDISSSMTWHHLPACPGLTPRTGSAIMAMVTARVESNYVVTGFSQHLKVMNITPKMSLTEIVRVLDNQSFGSTDCALPFEWAIKQKLPMDVACVYTDNETNHGRSRQPSVALKDYRRKMGIDAKLVVVGMESNGFTIADPQDPGMLDIVGFDTHAPSIISEFAMGTF